MPVFVKDGRSVLFVHVPKTGGTSIERLFVRSGWAMHGRETRRTQPEVFPLMRCSPQHLHGALLEQLYRVDRFDVAFLIVRDPVARFRSEYVMRNSTAEQTAADQVEAWTDRVLRGYDDNPYLYDNHLRPQVEFLVEGAEVWRLEDGLEDQVADLNTRFDLGLNSRLPRASHSKRAGVPSSSVQVTPAVAARIAEFYRGDYERFGYPLPG